MGQNVYTINSSCGYYTMHREILLQWPTFPHVLTYQITLPTLPTCVAEYKETEDIQLRIAKFIDKRLLMNQQVQLH